MSPSDYFTLALTVAGFIFGFFTGRNQGFKLAIIIMQNLVSDEEMERISNEMRKIHESE